MTKGVLDRPHKIELLCIIYIRYVNAGGNSMTGAIAGGVAAAAALLLAAPAIAIAWRCRSRKPEECYFDVLGLIQKC